MGEMRDRDQRSGGPSRVTNDILRLDSNPVGDGKDEGADAQVALLAWALGLAVLGLADARLSGA